MFGDVGMAEMAVVLLIALFVFGPDRLPTLARDLGRTLRKGRLMLKSMTDDLKTELGPEVGDLDLASLHPKKFVESIFADEEPEPAKPVSRVLPPGQPAPWDPDTT